MPYINTITNVKVTDEQANNIKSRFGKAIEVFPGKSEAWLMVGIKDDYKLYFRGSDEPCAFVNVSIFGSLNSDSCQKMTALVCDILSEELPLSADRIYVKYDSSTDWGWNGSNF